MAGVSIGEYSGPDHDGGAEFEYCVLNESPVVVRFTRRVLQDIRVVAVAGLLSIRRGGLEVGGLLFGTIEGFTVSVVEFRPLSIEYFMGPSFSLSPSDEANLQKLLEEPSIDPQLADLRPVGWYHSHTRSDVFLSAEDIGIHDRFFPGTAQIAVVIKPFKFEPAKFGVFARTADLRLSGYPPSCYFEVGNRHPSPEIPGGELSGQPAPLVVPEVIPVADAVPAVVALPVLSRRQRVVRFFGPNFRAIAAAGLLCAGAGVFVAKRSPPGEQVAPMRLHLSAAGDELTIAWDSDSRAIKQARAGSVSIIDGGQQNAILPLDDDSLKRGTVTYVRRTGDVVVRMLIAPESGPVIEEVARYIGPSPAPKPVLDAKIQDPDPELLRMRAELERAKTELTRMQPGSERARQLALEPAKQEPPRQIFNAAESIKPASPPPEVKLPETVPQLQLTKPALPPVAVSVSPAAPPVQQQHKPAVKPASGRAIWTGRLPKGGLLLLDARRPSVGTLTGRFPQSAARIRVYPADLAPSGIVIYTNAAPSVAVEPPSAANGWNLTTFAVDPKRSRAITMLESPGQQNGWKPRLLIRSEDKAVSMLVIDWEELAEAHQ